MAGLIRLIIAVVLAITVVPWLAHLLWQAWQQGGGLLPRQDGLWFAVGLGVSVPLVLWNRPNALVHTFIHETCHAIFCLLLGARVTSFRVSDGQGGAVGHERVDPIRGTIIAIAPYTLPLLLALVLLARWWWDDPGTLRAVLTAAVGFFFVHHLHALYYNIRINFWGSQADLVKVGRPLSAVLIASALMLTMTVMLRMLW